MMTIELDPQGTLTEGPTQRLLYVLSGKLTLSVEGSRKLHKLTPGSFAYIPSGHAHTLTAFTAARVAVIDKPFLPLESEPNPTLSHRPRTRRASVPLNGDPDLQVARSFPPPSPQVVWLLISQSTP